MEKLRDLVLAAERKNTNHWGQWFSSEQDLRDIFTEDTIRNALCDENIQDDCKIDPEHIEQAVKFVIYGAFKIFAILVHIRHTSSLLRFIETDNYQTGLDSRLPFEERRLKAILKDPASQEFYERQWHFIAPVFCDSVFRRILPPETILPITHQEFLGKGSFGIVYGINIAPSHQQFKSNTSDCQPVCPSRPFSTASH